MADGREEEGGGGGDEGRGEWRRLDAGGGDGAGRRRVRGGDDGEGGDGEDGEDDEGLRSGGGHCLGWWWRAEKVLEEEICGGGDGSNIYTFCPILLGTSIPLRQQTPEEAYPIPAIAKNQSWQSSSCKASCWGERKINR